MLKRSRTTRATIERDAPLFFFLTIDVLQFGEIKTRSLPKNCFGENITTDMIPRMKNLVAYVKQRESCKTNGHLFIFFPTISG